MNKRIFLALLIIGGFMAAEAHEWVTIHNDEKGIRADFPHLPLEMTIELPFQNTPPVGDLHFYSAPTQMGLFVLSIWSSPLVDHNWLKKEKFHLFFETILSPHLFYDPNVFRQHQTFEYAIQAENAASFRFTYEDHESLKRLEGINIVKGTILYTYFYLAAEDLFDFQLFHRFVDSVHILLPAQKPILGLD